MFIQIAKNDGRNPLKNLILDAAMTISDHGNVFISKFITIFGLSSLGFTGATSIAGTELIQKAIPNAQDFAQACANTPSVAVYATSFGGIMLGLKYGAEIYFSWLERKKGKNEKPANKDDSL
jgi:hypothetical protein